LGNQGVAQRYEIMTELLTTLELLNTKQRRKVIDSKITNFTTCKAIEMVFLDVIEVILIKYYYQTAKQEHYINLQTGLLDNLLMTNPILTIWHINIDHYPNWHISKSAKCL